MRRFVLVLAFLGAGAALAHEGVKNPAVMARMHGMKDMGAATKVLGQMVKGEVAFDASKAEAARDQIADEAAQIESLFKAREDDPKSEALPAIWENYSDFSAKSEALRVATGGGVSNIDELWETLGQIGSACKACHKAYRE